MGTKLELKPVSVLEVAMKAVTDRIDQCNHAEATGQSRFIRGMVATELNREYARFVHYRLNIVRSGRN